jgi:hypothetical protein
MVMEWITSGPVNQLGIRINDVATVVFHCGAGVEQHICNTRYWNGKTLLGSSPWAALPIETLVIRATKASAL